MFCKNCGKELKETAKYCAHCGVACDAALSEKKHKKKTKFIGIVAAAIVVLSVGVIAGYLLLNNPLSQTLRALKKEDYSLAADIIVQNKDLSGNEKLTKFLEEKIENLKNGYERETMTHEDVEGGLRAIEGLAIPSVTESLENAKQTVFQLYRSRTYQTVRLLQSEMFYPYGLDERTVFTYTYDENGVLAGWQQIDEEYNGYGAYDQTYVGTVTFPRDEVGNIQKVIFDEDGDIFEMDAEYSDGQLVRYSGEYADGDQCIVEFEYDAANRLILAQWVDIWDGEEDIYQQVKMKYHSEGWLEERSWLNVIRDDIEIVEKYNADGQLCEQLWYDDSVFLYEYIYSYNENGQLANRDSINGNGIHGNVEYNYDDNGDLISIIRDYDSLENEDGWIFRGNGKTLETTGWIGDESSIGYSYVYDDDGNVLKKSRVSKGADEEEVYQQIEYTYIDVSVPMNYEGLDIQDPCYLLFMSEYIGRKIDLENNCFYF